MQMSLKYLSRGNDLQLEAQYSLDLSIVSTHLRRKLRPLTKTVDVWFRLAICTRCRLLIR